MLLLIFWIVMSISSFTYCSYMKGRTDQRMKLDPTYFSEIPWGLGQVSCLIWPMQLLGGGLWYLSHVSANAGAGKGITLDAERKELRALSRKVHEQEDLTWRILTEKNIDPSNIDEMTKRALMTAAIRFAMEEDTESSRAITGYAPFRISDDSQRKTFIMDILDANGHEIKDPLNLDANPLHLPLHFHDHHGYNR